MGDALFTGGQKKLSIKKVMENGKIKGKERYEHIEVDGRYLMKRIRNEALKQDTMT